MREYSKEPRPLKNLDPIVEAVLMAPDRKNIRSRDAGDAPIMDDHSKPSNE